MRCLPLLCLLSVLCSGCADITLLNKDDYKESQWAFMRGDSAGALKAFPAVAEDGNVVEQGDFITTEEKAYLSLIQGQPQIEDLQKHAAALQDKVRFTPASGGKTINTFFYARTAEDYYPAEHEIIWMHFLLSWGYSLQGKHPQGCAEAGAARSLLSPPGNVNVPGHFDDPTLRIFLATLWTMCGEWREARTDFHAAWALDNSLTWAEMLSERDKPPANLFVMLGGPGPEVPPQPDPPHPPVPVTFELRGLKRPLFISDAHGISITRYLSPDAGNWYRRDMEREKDLHNMIRRSAYAYSAKNSNILPMALLGGLSGIVVWLECLNPDTFVAAFPLWQAVPAGIVFGAVVGAVYDYLEIPFVGGDTNYRYRFVRYLPEYVWVGWSDRQVAYPAEFRVAGYSVKARPAVSSENGAVTIAHIADAR